MSKKYFFFGNAFYKQKPDKKRITQFENGTIVGGDEESHEIMVETCSKVNNVIQKYGHKDEEYVAKAIKEVITEENKRLKDRE
jgi:hypothetical protein